VNFRIHIEPIKNGPHINGMTPDTFGWSVSYHHHHFRFLAIKLTILTTKTINNPAGKNRLKELSPSIGTVNQGKIIISNNNAFEYFKNFIVQPPNPSIRNNLTSCRRIYNYNRTTRLCTQAKIGIVSLFNCAEFNFLQAILIIILTVKNTFN
jgi:hypothetical protein